MDPNIERETPEIPPNRPPDIVLRQFLAEIRDPINSIVGCQEILSMMVTDDEADKHEILDIIAGNLNYILAEFELTEKYLNNREDK